MPGLQRESRRGASGRRGFWGLTLRVKSVAAFAEKAEPLTHPVARPRTARAQRGRAACVEFTPLGKSHM